MFQNALKKTVKVATKTPSALRLLRTHKLNDNCLRSRAQERLSNSYLLPVVRSRIFNKIDLGLKTGTYLSIAFECLALCNHSQFPAVFDSLLIRLLNLYLQAFW